MKPRRLTGTHGHMPRETPRIISTSAVMAISARPSCPIIRSSPRVAASQPPDRRPRRRRRKPPATGPPPPAPPGRRRRDAADGHHGQAHAGRHLAAQGRAGNHRLRLRGALKHRAAPDVIRPGSAAAWAWSRLCVETPMIRSGPTMRRASCGARSSCQVNAVGGGQHRESGRSLTITIARPRGHRRTCRAWARRAPSAISFSRTWTAAAPPQHAAENVFPRPPAHRPRQKNAQAAGLQSSGRPRGLLQPASRSRRRGSGSARRRPPWRAEQLCRIPRWPAAPRSAA